MMPRALSTAAILALMSGCKGCQPQLPYEDPPDPPVDSPPPPDDTASPDDTADTGPTLPPRCDQMEVEPNSGYDLSEPITMEQWWCGTFLDGGAVGDPEFLTFTPSQTGWVSVSVEAAARGSEADAQFLFYDDRGDAVLVYDGVTDGVASTDPKVVVPADTLGTYGVGLAETGYLTGESYTWALSASLVKAPVEWDFEEAEGNDADDDATPFPIDQVVFGTIGRVADRDWYHLSVPDGLQAVDLTVEAYGSGSPANLKITAYDSATGATKFVSYHGVIDYDLDPYREQKVTAATEWDLLVEDENSVGSPFSWYTLSITGVPAE